MSASLVSVMIGLTEALISTKRMKEDAAIGLVFPVFSVAVLLINKFAGNLHLIQIVFYLVKLRLLLLKG